MFKRIIINLIRYPYDLRTNILYLLKIYKIYNLRKNELIEIDKKIKTEHQLKWKKLSKNIYLKWLRVFTSISGKHSADFVPENLYYTMIEPRLNNRIYTFSYADKNFYDILYPSKDIFPLIIFRKINGCFYDKNYQPAFLDEDKLQHIVALFDKIIIKPSAETGGGRNIELLTRNIDNELCFLDGQRLTLQRVNKKFPENFVIQEVIEQHEFFKQFNPSSINTVRVFTYRSWKDEKVIPVSSVLRIGKAGSIVDNQASGGISCGISVEGRLNDFAVSKYGNKYQTINNIEFKGIKDVYMFDEIKKLAIDLASRMFYSRVNGFDFCVDKSSKVRLLEVNTKNLETNFLQMNNGPLFGEFTDEVIEYCRENKKIYTIHLRI